MIDLRIHTAKQALVLAKMMSGLTCEEIAERSGVSYPVVRRYFQEHDTDYAPSIYRIPALCKALGNRVLFDWQEAQLEEMNAGDIRSGAELQSELNRLTRELGELAGVVDEGVRDGTLSRTEARRISGEARDVERQARRIRDGLQHIAESTNPMDELE